jgi:hypothetical protein
VSRKMTKTLLLAGAPTKRLVYQPGITRFGLAGSRRLPPVAGPDRDVPLRRLRRSVLRCGKRPVLERRFLMRIATSLNARLGRRGIKYWLQVHGTCSQCLSDRTYSPAEPRDCISKALFFRHALDAYGFRLQILSSPSGVAVKIVDVHRCVAKLEQIEDSRRSDSACLVQSEPTASSSVEDIVRAFLHWANGLDYAVLRWSGRSLSLRYAGSFGGPGRD